jgi:hypothetical protein
MFNASALGLPTQTQISIAWIDLAEQEAKARMAKRGDPRDDWKLAHWNEYVQRRIEPPLHPSITRFDNLQFDEAAFTKLIERLSYKE